MNPDISPDDDIPSTICRRPERERTSANAVLERHPDESADVRRRRVDAAQRLLELSRTANCGRGVATWSREDLHVR